MFEPFEGNKKSVKNLIGIIINFVSEERNNIWALVDNLYYSQLRSNLFNSEFILEDNSKHILLSFNYTELNSDELYFLVKEDKNEISKEKYSLPLISFYTNLCEVFIEHRRITSMEEISFYFTLLLRSVFEQSLLEKNKNILYEIDNLLKNKENSFFSGKIIYSTDISEYILKIKNSCQIFDKFKENERINFLIEILNNISLTNKEINSSQEISKMRIILILMITRIFKNEELQKLIKLIMKLLPNIFYGPRKYFSNIVNISYFKEFSSFYDPSFETQYNYSLESNLILQNYNKNKLKSVNGNVIKESSLYVNEFNENGKLNDEKIDKQVNQQIAYMKKLDYDQHAIVNYFHNIVII